MIAEPVDCSLAGSGSGWCDPSDCSDAPTDSELGECRMKTTEATDPSTRDQRGILHRVWLRVALVIVVALTSLAVLNVAIGGQSLAAGDDDPAIVRCEPYVVTGPATTTLTVDLYVENAVNLYGADIRITFDTTAAQVVDADPAMPGVQIQTRRWSFS